MLIDAATLDDASRLQGDIVVVGAGPAGIVIALELASTGLDVILVESGGPGFSEETQQLGDAAHWNPDIHAPMSECTRRIIGGASTIWGGRCVPFDPLDFDPRPYITDTDWPVSHAEIAAYYQRACDWFFCGDTVFDINDIPGISQKTIVPGLPDGEVLTSELERWSLPTNFGKEYSAKLRISTSVRLVHNLTCTEIVCRTAGKVDSITGRTLSGKTIDLESSAYVIAGGGLETTRLLMVSDRMYPGGIGNHSDKLGRYYAGHISGRIAKVHFSTPPEKTVFGFDRDPIGVYLRRRFTFSREFHHQNRLPNAAAWLVNPDIYDPGHRNGILSFVYLMLTSPVIGKRLASEAIRKAAAGGTIQRNRARHLLNMLTDLPRTLTFIASFGISRLFARRKVPGFFVYSKANVYPLHYFCEHIPDPASRVTLSEEQDALGVRRLDIDLRYSDADVDTVLRAHEYWDDYLKRHGCGSLEYMVDDRRASILAQIEDGYHQLGTTRMSDDPVKGVVDGNCRVHGFSDLYVASSSVFVTSGQANSTFTIIAFALRLADHLRQLQAVTAP